MAIPFIFPFFFLSHLLVLLSVGQGCPETFYCGDKWPPLRFPFSNESYPSCGPSAVNCENPNLPTIDLQPGRTYEVKEFWVDDSVVKVKDQTHSYNINDKSCYSFFALTIPNRSSISYSIFFPSLTLFKCNNTNTSSEARRFFHGNHSHDCPELNFTVYYSYPDQNDDVPSPKNPPPNCQVIQVPASSEKQKNASDIFSLMGGEFSVGLNVSRECLKCHRNRGQCINEPMECLGVAGKIYIPWILVAAIPGGVILLICLLILLSKSSKFCKNKTMRKRDVEDFLMNQGPLFPKRYTYSEVKKMTNSFRTKLGQGGYGSVFKGELKNGCPVAVKVLKELKGSGEEFINEVAAISRTSHVNIVTLLGFCFDGRNRALICEFMPNGSLEKFIYAKNSTYHQLGWDVLYNITIGIARGLEYLHRGCNTRILHFDIKPHNILLDENFCPKISDFGLAKVCPGKDSIISLLGARGTIGYIAPEVFSRNFGNVSYKSDVYSYGMMVLEMVGGRRNIEVEVEVDSMSEIYFPHWIYDRLERDEMLDLHGITDEQANENLRKMIIVGLWCMQTNPSHRPSMTKVVEMLVGNIKALQIPPKPFLSSPPRPRSPSQSTTHPS